MSVCLNGWAGIPDENDPRLRWIIVPGTRKKVLLRKEAAPVFAAILSEINKLLIPLDGGPLDGWEYREARSGAGLSNHSGAVAVDFRYDVLLADNELHWPASKHAIMHKLLDKYTTTTGKRIFGWGGDWKPGRSADEMHLELIQNWSPGSQGSNCSPSDIANVVRKLGIRSDGTFSAVKKAVAVIVPPKPPAPAPTGKGAEWWLKFLHARKVPNERAWFAIGMRESGGDPSCLYPTGAPWGDWKHGNGRHFDVGTTQVNDRHLDDLIRLGYDTDMRCMLNPEKNLDYAITHLSWSDWGIKLSGDGYSFDWTGWPSPYKPGESGAVSAEAGFKEWWDAYPKYAAALNVTSPVKPVPKPVKPKPVQQVSLSGVKRNQWADVRVVQAGLNRVLGSRLVIDGKWGPGTQAAFDKFRKEKLALSGANASGSVGKASLTALGDRAGFKVTA